MNDEIMSKSLVFKGLSFVKKGQGGKLPLVESDGKEKKRAVSSMAVRDGRKESRLRSKGTLQGYKDSHGGISKSGRPKMNIKERGPQREVTSKQRTDETNSAYLYGVKRKRSRKMIKKVSCGNFGFCKVLLLYILMCLVSSYHSM